MLHTKTLNKEQTKNISLKNQCAKETEINKKVSTLLNNFKKLAKQKFDALGTLEIVIIIAVLMAIALLFREQITAFAEEIMDKVFDSSIIDQI